MSFDNIAIVGAGGWGTALAVVWAQRHRSVTLWGHNEARAESLQQSRVNEAYLPAVRLPDNVKVTSAIGDCAEADLIVIVTPSVALRGVATRLANANARPRVPILSCTKGIEHGSGLRMSQILEEKFPAHPILVLSGPNLAVEVAQQLPTATVLASRAAACAEELQKQLSTERFRIYTADETVGVELGGALKNVFAIAAGASDGLGLGDNSKAALVTRALAEMLRIGTAMGGNPRTFYGLSGAGDLIATCFSKHSRNRRFGEQLGRGQTMAEVTAMTRTVAEGVPTSESAFECARRVGAETPIIDQVYEIVHHGKPPQRALEELMQRELKAERI